MVWFRVINATFNSISVVSWWSVKLVEETIVSRESHRPVASHRQTLPHNVVSSTPCLRGLRDSNLLTVRKRMIKLTSINMMFLFIEIILCNHVRYSFGLFFKLTIHILNDMQQVSYIDQLNNISWLDLGINMYVLLDLIKFADWLIENMTSNVTSYRILFDVSI